MARSTSRKHPNPVNRRAIGLALAGLLAGPAAPILAVEPETSFTATCTVLENERAVIGGTIDGFLAARYSVSVLDYSSSQIALGTDYVDGPSGDFEITTVEGYTAVPGTSVYVELRYVGPAAFTFVTCVALVRSVTELTNDLAASGVLSQGEANSLLVKVDNSTASATRGNVEAAVRQLEAFKNEINALYNSGRISLAERDAILAAADRQIAALRAGA